MGAIAFASLAQRLGKADNLPITARDPWTGSPQTNMLGGCCAGRAKTVKKQGEGGEAFAC